MIRAIIIIILALLLCISGEINLDITLPTASKYLRRERIRNRRAAKREELTELHKLQRLIWAEQALEWPLRSIYKEVFLDEVRVDNQFNNDLRVWPEDGTRYEPQNVQRIQHSGRISQHFLCVIIYSGNLLNEFS